MNLNRRSFLKWMGRGVSTSAIGGACWHILRNQDNDDAEFIQPERRYAWEINLDKCTNCGKCENLCVRKPSAVKALNDQTMCSNCVVCYGHIKEKNIASDKIESDGTRICPYDAVTRKRFSGGIDGYFSYDIDQGKCTGCGKCTFDCSSHGSASMFLAIRPDICLGCNECDIARHCPEDAIDRVPIVAIDDIKEIPFPGDDFTMPPGMNY